MSAHHERIGKLGGLTTMASHDGRAIAANARKSSPSDISYWIARQPTDLPASTREARAEAARRLWFTKLAAKSSALRRRAASNGRTA